MYVCLANSNTSAVCFYAATMTTCKTTTHAKQIPLIVILLNNAVLRQLVMRCYVSFVESTAKLCVCWFCRHRNYFN